MIKQIITAKPSTTTVSADFSVLRGRLVWVTVKIAATTTPAGNVAIQGSGNGSDYSAVYLDANKVYGENFTNASTGFTGGFTVPFTALGGALVVQIPIANPPPNLKVIVTITSGGAAGDKINAWYSSQRTV